MAFVDQEINKFGCVLEVWCFKVGKFVVKFSVANVWFFLDHLPEISDHTFLDALSQLVIHFGNAFYRGNGSVTATQNWIICILNSIVKETWIKPTFHMSLGVEPNHIRLNFKVTKSLEQLPKSFNWLFEHIKAFQLI